MRLCRGSAPRRWTSALVGVGLLGLLLADEALSQKRPNRPADRRQAKPAALKLPPLKTPEDKLKLLEAIRRSMPTQLAAGSIRYTSEDLDRSLEMQIGAAPEAYAGPVGDEAFIRRVSLDLTGQVPAPRVVRQFVDDPGADKRARLIDELLESEDYARHWARYWRSVIFYDSAANKNRVNPQALEDWLAAQFQENVPWDRIVAEMVSATPQRNRAKKNDWGQDHGPNNFVLACDNKPDELASQTARLFMGISIQCAECHNHPFDRWKREQFHELAAFFAPGKYKMPDQYDPSKVTIVDPVFLLGEEPPAGLNADARRVAVAAYLIYNTDNYWFARAFVNRTWSELLGDGFYDVDSLGPDQDVVHQLVVNRLAAVFRYRNFDVKWLLRLVMNSRAYQRDIRAMDSDKMLFTAVRPSRLRPEQVADAVERLTGSNQNLHRQIERTFKMNPSVPQEDLEGSMQQALLLMNNRVLQTKLTGSDLRQRLAGMKSDEKMIEELYLGVLARTPTIEDRRRAERHLRSTGDRAEAIDDLLWVLVNSTEFLTKR